jgi:UDP-glucose 4-epimerase
MHGGELELQADAGDLSILVTGGAGFIGSHLCERLLTSGAEVTCLDNLSSGKLRNLSGIRREKRFQLIRGDVLDFKTISKAVKSIDVVCHLAAKVGVKHYVEHPIEVVRTNVFGTHNLLEACRRKKLKRFVFASTSEVYGKNPDVPLKEEFDRILGPPHIDRWCYSTSKSIDEHLCYSYGKEYDIPLTILRYFNTYGPRQESSDYGAVVSIFMRRVLNNQAPQVHGDGKQTRSFMFITDAIDGALLSIVRSDAKGEAFNIGNPVETGILELADSIIRVAGKERELKPELIPYDEFYGRSYEDLKRRVPDISKAKRVLGFEPRVALMNGLHMTYEWYRKESVA